ncbi:MAG: PAS domain S-box protein, partial [Verrucomicrobiota bacterium]
GAACLIERDLKRRRQVEKELGAAYRTTQRQAVELRSIIDCMPEAVYFGTSKGITLSNENARRMFGVSLTNETGLELAQKAALRSPLTGELLGEETLQFNRALKGETVIEEIMATRADNGEVVHLRIACAPLMEEGEVIGAVAINSDITQRKQVEMALSQSEERYRRLMRLLPVPVYMCDREGFITFSNQKATELWGRETVPGFDRWCGSLRIFSPDGTPLALDVCPMAVALREGRSVRDEEILVERADGSRRWVLAHPDPIVDSSGEVIGAVNVLVDITPLRKTEEALRESAQRLRSHQEHSPIAVIEMDADLAITGWTRAAEKLFGWSAGEMQGKSIE